VQPTTEPPPGIDYMPNDLSGLFHEQDMAQPCGDPNQACCSDNSCKGNSTCNSNHYCIDPTVTCGQQGQACCGLPPTSCTNGLTCNGVTCTTPCGASGKACCPNLPQCNQGTDKCINNVCTACGATGDTCCPGPSCDSTYAVCDESNKCIPCGMLGLRCCAEGCAEGTCGPGTPDLSPPADMSRDLSQPPTDFSMNLDGSLMINMDGGLSGTSLPLWPQGGGVPAGPPLYCQ
jgi:hypothetical protein